MTHQKIALIIGNNKYENAKQLPTAASDADVMAELLRSHENGDTNFQVQSTLHDVSNEYIRKEISQLLKREEAIEHALLYFSGHGHSIGSDAYLCGVDTDTNSDQPGVPFSWIAELINSSKIPEITVIFDCCFAGAMFNTDQLERETSLLRRGVTFLGATMRNDVASSNFEHGRFTSLLKHGLNGAAKDMFGNVSAGSLYSLADRMLGAIQQRPVFKTSQKHIGSLRLCSPQISTVELKKLISAPFFERIDSIISLDREILSGKPSKFYMNYTDLLLLTKYERLGFLTSENDHSLIELHSKWLRVHLSSHGEVMWDAIKYGRI